MRFFRDLCGLRWVSLALLSLALLWASPAQGKEPEPGTPRAIEIAKRHFEKARAAYGMGSYKTAIEELRTALRYDPNGKDLVYNLALVHEKLGELEPAIENFKRYVEMEDDPKERERVELIIQRLEGAREEVTLTEEPEVTPAPVAEPPESRPAPMRAPEREPAKKGRLDGWVYATGGVSIAAALVGAVFGVRALSTRPRDTETTGPGKTPDDLREQNDQAHSYAVVADVAFAVSLVSAGAAGFLYFSRDAETTPTGARGSRTMLNLGVSF